MEGVYMADNDNRPRAEYIPADPQKVEEHEELLENQRKENWAKLRELFEPQDEIYQATRDLSPEEITEVLNYIDYIKYKREI